MLLKSSSTNLTPCLAFGASSVTSSYVSLPKDELTIEKVMDTPTLVGVNNKEFNPDVKHTAADLKIGAGKKNNDEEEALHDNFFSEPVMKVKSTTLGPPAQSQDSSQKRKTKDSTLQSGAGHIVKKPKLSGRGVSFK